LFKVYFFGRVLVTDSSICMCCWQW